MRLRAKLAGAALLAVASAANAAPTSNAECTPTVGYQLANADNCLWFDGKVDVETFYSSNLGNKVLNRSWVGLSAAKRSDAGTAQFTFRIGHPANRTDPSLPSGYYQLDPSMVRAAYVGFENGTQAFRAGYIDKSIAALGDDEFFAPDFWRNELNQYENGLGFSFPLTLGGTSIQFQRSLGNTKLALGLENIEGGGTAIASVSHKSPISSSHITILASGILDATPDNIGVHAGATFETGFGAVRLASTADKSGHFSALGVLTTGDASVGLSFVRAPLGGGHSTQWNLAASYHLTPTMSLSAMGIVIDNQVPPSASTALAIRIGPTFSVTPTLSVSASVAATWQALNPSTIVGTYGMEGELGWVPAPSTNFSLYGNGYANGAYKFGSRFKRQL